MNEFQTKLEPILNGFSGVIGFYAKRLDDGFTLGYNQNEVFAAASVVKVPILFEFRALKSQPELDEVPRVELAL